MTLHGFFCMTFAEEMVTRLEALMRDAAGLQSVTIDGHMVTYADLVAQYEFWKRKVATESGKRATVAQIDLGGF